MLRHAFDNLVDLGNIGLDFPCRIIWAGRKFAALAYMCKVIFRWPLRWDVANVGAPIAQQEVDPIDHIPPFNPLAPYLYRFQCSPSQYLIFLAGSYEISSPSQRSKL